jgi:hypothetical protein
MMNRDEALGKADALVSAWIADPPKNGRGYVADGWKAPSLVERTEAVERLAMFLMQPDRPSTNLVPPVPVTRLFGWAIDGSEGPPEERLYNYAQSILGHRVGDGRLYKVEETEALRALVAAYEEAQKAPKPPRVDIHMP